MTPTRKVYYLSSCDTCQRILHEIKTLEDFTFQDVKEEPICEQTLNSSRMLQESMNSCSTKEPNSTKSVS